MTAMSGIMEKKPWNFDQCEHVICIKNVGPFRNFAMWKRTAPRIKSNIVIIWIPVSEQSNRSTGVKAQATTFPHPHKSWQGSLWNDTFENMLKAAAAFQLCNTSIFDRILYSNWLIMAFRVYFLTMAVWLHYPLLISYMQWHLIHK